MYNEQFGDAIGIFSDILHFLRDLYDRKALFLNICEEIDYIKWRGFPLLVKDVVDELVEKIGDAITYSLAIRLIGLRFPDVAENISRELILRIDDLAEWEYDRVISLLIATQGLLNINRVDLSKEALNSAIQRIPTIPDRSDRSDALAKAIKLLAMHGDIDRAMRLLDDILYEPKKVEAVFSILDNLPDNHISKELIESLESKIDSYDIPIFRAKLADRLSTISPKSSSKICDSLVKKIDLATIGSLRDLTAVYWCIIALTKSGDKQLILARNYFLRIIPQLLRRVEERPFLELFINILNTFIEKRLLLEEVDRLLDELKVKAKQIGDQNSLFILNRIGYLLWNRGDLEGSLNIFKSNFFEARKLTPPLSVYSCIDIGVTLAKILNKLPDTIPDQIITQMSQVVSPSERPILEITISRDALTFLRENFKGKPLGQLVDQFIMKEQILRSFDVSKKTRDIIIEFMKRGEPIVLHYILKYIYKIPIGESERSIYLRLLGKAVELFSAGRFDESQQYVDLILEKLEREGFPIFISLIEFLSEYLIKII